MHDKLSRYDALFTRTRTRPPVEETQRMVNEYYDLVTDFYELGWGPSFHFAPRFRDESLAASLTRHQHYLAAALSLRPTMRVLDAGCGIGGPLCAIHRFSGATMVGLNNNAYQVGRARQRIRAAGCEPGCTVVHGSFMAVPEADASFDAVIAIEALCHAPDRTACFAELFRTLRPGGSLGGYDWCLTPRFDSANQEHHRIKSGIERGNGLPPLGSVDDLVMALKDVGFEVVAVQDRALTGDADTPWYAPLVSRGWSLRELASRPAGRWLTNRSLAMLEAIRLAPRGARDVSTMLNDGADALVRGGQHGIFTPMLFFHARKAH